MKRVQLSAAGWDSPQAAHEALDLAVDALYRPGKPFESDEDRLQLLFQMYEDLIRKKEGRLHA